MNSSLPPAPHQEVEPVPPADGIAETAALPEGVAPPEETAAPVAAEEPRSSGRFFWVSFALCAAVTVLPLWVVEFMPGVDLPQHMAQIALWQQYDAGIGRDMYWLNWFTPYLFGYSVVRLLATVMTIESAFRLVSSAYVLGLGFGMLAWLKALGRPRELALLAFPAAYGFSFQWGFFNYSCALPVALFFLAFGEHHLKNPTRRSSAILALFSVILFFAHVLILAAAGVILATRAVVVRGFLRGFVAMLPAALGALLVIPWMLLVRSNHGSVRHSDIWWEGWERAKQLPARMSGVEGDTWAIALSAVLLVWLVVSIAVTPWRRWSRFLVPAVALALYFAIPSYAMDTFFLAPRFGIVFAIALVPALAWPTGRVVGAIVLVLTVALVGPWGGWQLTRFRGFDEEARGLGEVLAKAEPGRSMLGLTYDLSSRHFRGAPFLHMPAYYQARRDGGPINFSFAVFFPQLIRYRHDKAPPMTNRLELDPSRFDWNMATYYDYFLVRSHKQPRGKAFSGSRGRHVKQVAHSGTWWLFENRSARQPEPAPEPRLRPAPRQLRMPDVADDTKRLRLPEIPASRE